MKVVLFCGGLGTRLREYSDTVPKPLVPVGHRPVMWHLMRYYAHFGHTEFILCLGFGGAMIRRYFLDYHEAMSNDFTLTNGGRTVRLHEHDIDDWTIHFIDTGAEANIGTRLLRVSGMLRDEPMFLANYADGLSDLPMDRLIDDFSASDALAEVAAVQPRTSFHMIDIGADNAVDGIVPMHSEARLINGGFFAIRPGIFEHMREGEDLVEHPFERLIARRQLRAYRHLGFWQAMDTLKDKLLLDQLEATEAAPWKVWQRRPVAYAPSVAASMQAALSNASAPSQAMTMAPRTARAPAEVQAMPVGEAARAYISI